ncbi:MAG: hypothetical protein AB7Q17_14770 [Phycisphaerae bacterium]
MSIASINIARVSQNLRAFNLLATVRGNQLGLFRVQNQLATGLRFAAPSEAPTDAADAGVFDRKLDTLRAVERNVRDANTVLNEADAAMADGITIVRDANTIAIQTAGDTLSTDERRALANTIDGIIQQAIDLGNRRYLDTYLFGGRFAGDLPFEMINEGVLFRGDDGQARTIVDTDLSQDSFTISGSEFFGAFSTRVRGIVDLDPAVTTTTRISDLRGTSGEGVRLGQITVAVGASQATIDLTGVATVGDLVDKLNAEMPDPLEAIITPTSVVIGPVGGAGPVAITIADVGGGQTARDLGITTSGGGIAGSGVDLDPVLSPRNKISELTRGAGLSLVNDIVIRNGNQSATVRLADAGTVEDVLNRLNGSNVGVWARIASDGRTIEVLNRVSGSALSIEEAGGGTATALGIRSMTASTPLSELNEGRGITTAAGDDFRIVTASGANIDVDVDGAATLQDVVDRINVAAGGAVTAGLRPNGNGLLLTDNTAGGGTLRVERLNLSAAIDGLGLDVAATGNQIVGRDVNPVRAQGVFTALLDLRDGLRRDDTRAIGFAAESLQTALRTMEETRGELAGKAKAMADRGYRIEDEVTATRILLSDVRDVDMSEAIVRFSQIQTALQANLNTAARVLNLSLLDYLR